MSADTEQQLESFVAGLEKTFADAGSACARSLFPETTLSDDSLLNELVISMLLWEASVDHAAKALERVNAELVDLHELRVCLPGELSAILGSRMPKSLERAQRLLSVLNTIYQRENDLTLDPLREMTKRDAQNYLGDIDGLPPYAAARVILFGMEWHAFPLDERLAKLLVAQGVLPSSAPLESQAAFLERGVRASDSARTYSLIEHWAQGQRGSSRSQRSRSRSRARGMKGATS